MTQKHNKELGHRIDSLLAPLFPQWAMMRSQARYRMVSYQRAYEAAKPSRLHRTRQDRGSADAVVGAAGDVLRIQARYLEENHDLAYGVLNTLVNNVVGVGIHT
ncbi:phage portal protein, partial [Candidatus Kaiserbacteria bacterium]|nr:phage portal protein [Candidatus Kaiserbacteria bacterium]